MRKLYTNVSLGLLVIGLMACGTSETTPITTPAVSPNLPVSLSQATSNPAIQTTVATLVETASVVPATPGSILSSPLTTPLVIASCTPTHDDITSPTYHSGAPVRSVVGHGHVVTGVVKSSRDCMPIAHAKLEMWAVGPNDAHPEEFRATLFTDQSGAYRFESNPTEHLHMRITIPGYFSIFSNAYHPGSRTEGVFNIVLRPDV